MTTTMSGAAPAGRLPIDLSHVRRVHGPPGTGKTRFLSAQVHRSVAVQGKRVLIASLTRTAAAEIAGHVQLPNPRAVGTLHSHAYRALGGGIAIAEAHLAEWNRESGAYRLSLDGESAELDDAPAEARRPGGTDGDKLLSAMQLLRARETPRAKWPPAVRDFARRWEAWKGAHDLLDFTDLLEEARRSTLAAPNDPHVLLVDEAQDLSRLAMGLVYHWARRAEMLIICGDSDQCLYAFAGAEPPVFHDPPLPPDQTRVLAQSYRVPAAVRDYAVGWIGQIRDRQPIRYHARRVDDSSDPATPEAPGRVRRLAGATWRAPERVIDELEEQLAAGRSAMVLASCSYMLAPTLRLLRERGIPFHNPYRVKRGDWNPLPHALRRVLAFLRLDEATFGRDARLWSGLDVRLFAETLEAKGVFPRGGKRELTLLPAEEEVPLRVLLEHMEEEAVGRVFEGDLRWWLDHALPAYRRQLAFPVRIAERWGKGELRRLAEPPPEGGARVVTGTIHSVKGGSADCVFVFPDLSLQGYLGWSRGVGSGWESVVRMFYVAFTRAREELVLCDQDSPSAVRWRAVPGAA